MNAPTLLLPPHSIESEQVLLGALLIPGGDAWDRIADVVTESDFFNDGHRRIFRHIKRLSDVGRPTDVVTVFESIERSNEINQTGGLAYLGDIANACPSAANCRRYAEVVRDKASLRRLQSIGDELAAACQAHGKDPKDIAYEFDNKLVVEMDVKLDEVTAIQTSMAAVVEYIENQYGGTPEKQVKTGFKDLDGLLGDFQPGQLIIIAARPSMGKTVLACNITANAVDAGDQGLFCSLETSERLISMRMLSARTGIPVSAMKTGQLSEPDWEQMTVALGAIHQQALWIDDSSDMTIAHIKARATRLQRTYGLRFIVVDYLQLMTGEGETRAAQVGSISRGLKKLAKDLKIPIIALAQINRGVEGRSDKRPLLSDLKESGDIEQDADIVIMLHREGYYGGGANWDEFAEAIVRKNKDGPVGTIPLRYIGKQMTFKNWEGVNPRDQETKSKSGGYKGE